MSEEGIVYIKWEPRPKLPRKKKKQFIKYMGPKAYKRYLLGEPEYLITSDYPIVNGVSTAPWNKRVWRKRKNDFFTPKLKVNSRYYTTIIINQNKDE